MEAMSPSEQEGKPATVGCVPRTRFLDVISRHWNVWRIAWQEQKRQEPVVVPQGRELEFLPAVLEIQESPPSPVGRTIIFIIIGVFTAALLWSVFGQDRKSV